MCKRTYIWGLFKYPKGHANAQMQGAQKLNREAYMEIRRAVRFAAQHSRWAFCKACGFFRQGMRLNMLAPPCGNAPPVNILVILW
jgi:hypothetical protein